MMTRPCRAAVPASVIPRPTRPVLEVIRRAIAATEDEAFEITYGMFETLVLSDYEALARSVEEINPGALEYVARVTRDPRTSPGYLTWL